MIWPTTKYGVILADPPWKYNNLRTVAQGAAVAQYPTMSVEELLSLPVRELAADDCALFLWATMPQLDVALDIMADWGFDYVTCAFTWVKKTKHGKWWSGMGFYTRANAELCLLGKRGRPKVQDTCQPQLIVAERGRHSAKPEEARQRIEKLFQGPYIELFARTRVPGWDAWGNEVK